jgi:hypothetical protein
MRLTCSGILALLAVVTPAQGQRTPVTRVPAAGQITDLSTGAALNGALIEFPALRRQATTGPNGRFSVTSLPTGRHKMVVSQLGFRTVVREVEITQGGFLTVPLEPDPMMLRSIEVQVDRLALRRRSVEVSVLAFERKQLLGSASSSTAEFIMTQLGGSTCATNSGRTLCLHRRGQMIHPVIYIDERRAFGLEELQSYPAHDIYLIESYDSGRMIRVYTTWFMQNLARSNSALQQIVIW